MLVIMTLLFCIESPFTYCPLRNGRARKGIVMLENYYENGLISTTEQEKRLIAVQAALEIAKASVAASSVHPRSDRVEDSLTGVADKIGSLADAIQAALIE